MSPRQPAQSAIDHGSPELGRIHWGRNFDHALAAAKQQNKLLLVLFDEVPGCSTCTGYGRQVLSHPLITEAIDFGETPFRGRGQLVIRAISQKQRPRR